MRKRFFIIIIFTLFIVDIAIANTISSTNNFTNTTSYSNMYPYMSNNMRKKLNPTPNTDGSTSKSMATVVKTLSTNSSTTNTGRSATNKNTTKKVSSKTNSSANTNTTTSSRRVVKRSSANQGRSATTNNYQNYTNSYTTNTTTKRNVVKRTNTARSSTNRTSTDTTYSYGSVSSERCFSDYIECMEDYCKREDTAYNRCYCSSKLAQIDSKYQNKINSLIEQIIELKSSATTTDEEITEYWTNNVTKYTGTNPWLSIDNALNIDWSTMESRVRGQNAFTAGHTYCVSHLNNCASMASNMRDAYKSEIARDCSNYETGLQKIQSIAESIIETYE